MYSTICASDGFGHSASNARTVITIPGVQNPHCRAPQSTNACWIAWRRPPCASPSHVSTVRPWASSASTLHALTGRPSISTVHAPHTWTSQPRLAPINPRSFRRKSSRVRWFGTSTRIDARLTVHASAYVSPCSAALLTLLLPPDQTGSRLFRGATHQHAGEMSFVRGRPVEIIHRRAAPRQRRCGSGARRGETAAAQRGAAERALRLRHPDRGRPDAPDGNPGFYDPVAAGVSDQHDPNTGGRTLIERDLEIRRPRLRGQRGHQYRLQQLARLQVGSVSVDEERRQRHGPRPRAAGQDDGRVVQK